VNTVELVLPALAVILLLLLAAALLTARLVGPEERELLRRIGRLPLRRKLTLGVRLATDAQVPLTLRLLPVLMLAYLLLPFDLVPDFIPALGQLDEVLLLGLALGVLLRRVPRGVIEAHVAGLELKDDSETSA
jgi:uncharacterized membrane protein YkvA (DUF1232 family)